MKKIVLLSSVAVVSLFASQLPEFEIKPTISKVLTEGNSRIDDYSMLGLELSKKIHEDMMLTLGYAKGDTDYEGSTRDTDIELYTLGVEYYLYTQNNFQTFLHGGVSYQSLDTKFNGRDSGYRLNYGAGMKYYFNDVVNIFAKASHLTDFGNRKNELHISTGIGFAFGKAPQEAQKTQTLSKQLQEKKPQETVKPEPKAQEPQKETPQTVAMVDSDGDGVADHLDKCSATPQKFQVDSEGCPISYDFEVYFDFDSSILTQQSIQSIQNFAQFLKSDQNNFSAVEIAGHTDSVGSKKYNQWLSERRAKAVYERLIQKGIDKDFMSYKGYGQEDPIVANDSEENRALNRRVEGRLIQ